MQDILQAFDIMKTNAADPPNYSLACAAVLKTVNSKYLESATGLDPGDLYAYCVWLLERYKPSSIEHTVKALDVYIQMSRINYKTFDEFRSLELKNLKSCIKVGVAVSDIMRMNLMLYAAKQFYHMDPSIQVSVQLIMQSNFFVL